VRIKIFISTSILWLLLLFFVLGSNQPHQNFFSQLNESAGHAGSNFNHHKSSLNGGTQGPVVEFALFVSTIVGSLLVESKYLERIIGCETEICCMLKTYSLGHGVSWKSQVTSTQW
jgi:hypothetical protein